MALEIGWSQYSDRPLWNPTVQAEDITQQYHIMRLLKNNSYTFKIQFQHLSAHLGPFAMMFLKTLALETGAQHMSCAFNRRECVHARPEGTQSPVSNPA